MKKIIESHINKLKEDIRLLDEIKSVLACSSNYNIPTNFTADELKQKYFFAKNGDLYVYIIRTEINDREALEGAFHHFKYNHKDKAKYSVSLMNKPKQYSKVLYVGSSASIKSRLSQHLGLTGPKVYSLQLSKWYNYNQVSIETIRIPEKYHSILYQIENAFWDYYQPLFGKKRD
ncbi:MAG: hypothetical protein PHW82_06510 [Bacteroidales bacterium]|nr:hypothetical protein [Bacteroidales bacterium]